jgi:hypothetical protein
MLLLTDAREIVQEISNIDLAKATQKWLRKQQKLYPDRPHVAIPTLKSFRGK